MAEIDDEVGASEDDELVVVVVEVVFVFVLLSIVWLLVDWDDDWFRLAELPFSDARPFSIIAILDHNQQFSNLFLPVYSELYLIYVFEDAEQVFFSIIM